MPKYIKKPITVEARQLTLTNAEELAVWCHGSWSTRYSQEKDAWIPDIRIHTLEGDMYADLGDWIIKGIKGEFYPCKDDIFRETYKAADEKLPLIPPGIDVY